MEELKKTYVMKGVGSPRYYLGGDFIDLDENWQKQGLKNAFSADTYIGNALPKLAKMLGVTGFHKKGSPMDAGYHPELDETPLLPPEDISKYRSVMGSLNWILMLRRFDIAFALSTLS